MPKASAESLLAFVEESIEPGSTVSTDDWSGYSGLGLMGYPREVVVASRQEEVDYVLLPRVHRVVSPLKRWLLGTHQGAVSHEHLDYYLDEFTSRFNGRASRHRGKPFYGLLQQPVAVPPRPYSDIVSGRHDRRGQECTG